MTEPTVQVPVSMIHELVETVGSKGMPTDLYLRFDALLPQPPLTPEPCARCGHSDQQHGAPVTAGGTGCALLSCPCGWFIPSPAAPPHIEDMAPGTTFTGSEYPRAVQRLTWDGMRVHPPVGPSMAAFRIDPSTIRDVTPPKEHR